MGKKCHDPGSNRGHLDLQSNALPTELSWPVFVVQNLRLLKVHLDETAEPKVLVRFYRDLNSDRRIQSPEC